MMTTMRAALQRIFCGSDDEPVDGAGIEAYELARPEGKRRYLMAAPMHAAPGPRPLVLLLHGAMASASQVLGLAYPPSPLSLWVSIGARENLIVVAPDGCLRGWNDGFSGMPRNPGTDDTGFIGAIIDHAIAEHGADPARVYVMGVSKGGFMTFRLACEIAPRLAAFATVLASMPIECAYGAPARPMPAMIVASVDDPFVPFKGGKFWYIPNIRAIMGVRACVDVWRKLAGFDSAPHLSAQLVPADGGRTRVTRHRWGAQGAPLQVELLEIAGAGHAEPSALKRYPRLINWLTGRQNGDLEVAEAAWAFFKDKRAFEAGLA
ncbi:MAG: hypothetical protein V4582_14075 [Pseudomonadota bacterium]